LVLHFCSRLKEIPDHTISTSAETRRIIWERDWTYARLDEQAIVEVGGKKIIRPKYVESVSQFLKEGRQPGYMEEAYVTFGGDRYPETFKKFWVERWVERRLSDIHYQ
jgi:hypothetical protein